MQIIDVQLHEPEPWIDDWESLQEDVRFRLLTEMTLASMDAVGVDIALINPASLGGSDWMWYAVSHSPDRLVANPGCDMRAPDAEQQIANLAAQRAVVACRASFGTDTRAATELLEAGTFDPFFRGARQHGLPIFLYPSKPYPHGFLQLVADPASRFPDVRLAVDHVGLPQPPVDEADSPPFTRLPQLLELARYPNVGVKFTSAPTLSEESYPFADVVDSLRQIIDAFGRERVMWGTDITRVVGRIGWSGSAAYRAHGDVPESLGDEGRLFWEHLGPYIARMWERAKSGYQGKHTYGEAVGYIRDATTLTDDEKAWVLGGSARHFLRWPKHL